MSSHVHTRLLALISGYCVSQAIACAARLRIADFLADAPRSSGELAGLAGCSEPHLHRLLHALSQVGVFRRRDGLFHQTPMSDLLRTDHPGGLLSHADFHGGEMYAVFGGLYRNIVTGSPAWDAVMGESAWQYFSSRPDRGAVFDATMKGNHATYLAELVAALPLSPNDVVADVGGGDGSLIREILERHPNIRGIVFDTPGVAGRATEAVRRWPHAGRCEVIGGDFFQAMPPECNVYILKHVLHDWDDQACARILARCREAMSAESRLLVVEQPAGSGQYGQDVWLDLGMMVFGGAERDCEGYEALVRAAQLEVRESRKAPWGTVIVARR